MGLHSQEQKGVRCCVVLTPIVIVWFAHCSRLVAQPAIRKAHHAYKQWWNGSDVSLRYRWQWRSCKDRNGDARTESTGTESGLPGSYGQSFANRRPTHQILLRYHGSSLRAERTRSKRARCSCTQRKRHLHGCLHAAKTT